MDYSGWLFWNSDTQIDFVYPRGRLYVDGAEDLRKSWKKLTVLAREKSICVVNTADYHFKNSTEIDETPDYIKTFPEHCMANTRGADFIKETDPEDSLIFNWNKDYLITPQLFEEKTHRNFIIRKDAFDVFKGNPHTRTIIQNIKPETVVVYGISRSGCIDAAVTALARKVKNIYIVEDALKHPPNTKLPYKKWQKKGVQLLQLKELQKMCG